MQEVNFVDIDSIIEDDMRNNMPSELDTLSTHTYIEEVSDINILSEEIKSNIAEVQGVGTVSVELQYGSDRDQCRGDGMTDGMRFDFEFQIKVDITKNVVLRSKYSINTEKFYS